MFYSITAMSVPEADVRETGEIVTNHVRYGANRAASRA